MKKSKLLILLIILMTFFVSCELFEDKKETKENSDGEDRSTEISPSNIDTGSDTGAGDESFVAIYEKLIAPYTYKHFCQGDYSETKNAWRVCLATSYMIAKGILYNNPVDNATLDKIVIGGIKPSASINDGIDYAKNDLGTSCVLNITTTNSNKSGAFNNIYQTIDAGYPVFALVNFISSGRNGTTISPNTKQYNSEGYLKNHWMLVVGIKVKDFNLQTGNFYVIDPANSSRNIIAYNITDFLSASLLASSSKNINLFSIGCKDDAITANYFMANIPELLFPTNNMTNISSPINFSWKAISGNPEYRIKISTSLSSWTAENGFLDTETNGDKNTGSNNSYYWSNAQYNTTYYWCVKSYLNGVSSKYSQPIKFTTSKNNTETRIVNLSGSLNYGNVNIGQTSDKTLTISNTGNSTMSVNSISVPNGYSVTGNQSFNISAGQSVNTTIRFSPQSAMTYSGNISVNANHTSGSNTISISGTGISPTPSFSVTPNQGNYTQLPSSNKTGSCSTNPYLGDNITMTCSSLTASTITFKIKKYSGSYQNTGNAYIKDGGVCGDIVSNNGNGVSFEIGASSITLTVPNNLSVGQTRTFYGIVISNNNSSVNRFYTLPITIKRNQ